MSELNPDSSNDLRAPLKLASLGSSMEGDTFEDNLKEYVKPKGATNHGRRMGHVPFMQKLEEVRVKDKKAQAIARLDTRMTENRRSPAMLESERNSVRTTRSGSTGRRRRKISPTRLGIDQSVLFHMSPEIPGSTPPSLEAVVAQSPVNTSQSPQNNPPGKKSSATKKHVHSGMSDQHSQTTQNSVATKIFSQNGTTDAVHVVDPGIIIRKSEPKKPVPVQVVEVLSQPKKRVRFENVSDESDSPPASDGVRTRRHLSATLEKHKSSQNSQTSVPTVILNSKNGVLPAKNSHTERERTQRDNEQRLHAPPPLRKSIGKLLHHLKTKQHHNETNSGGIHRRTNNLGNANGEQGRKNKRHHSEIHFGHDLFPQPTPKTQPVRNDTTDKPNSQKKSTSASLSANKAEVTQINREEIGRSSSKKSKTFAASETSSRRSKVQEEENFDKKTLAAIDLIVKKAVSEAKQIWDVSN